MVKVKIILASTSPRRRSLMVEHGIPHEAVSPVADETAVMKSVKSKNPYAVANAIALAKAESVRSKYDKGLIIGSDTIVVLGNKIIGKPKNQRDAFRIISSLSGSVHKVITSVAFIDAQTGKTLVTSETTKVHFSKVPPAEIRRYIKENNVMDKAGAYAIQEGADPYVKKLEGPRDNVVGFPMKLVKRIIKIWKKI